MKRVLEQFLKPTQQQLFQMLCKMFNDKKLYKSDNDFILVEGEVPVMLLAHLDTVHKEPVRDICKTNDGNILMSPQGIGGDDRCGVYAIVNAYELSAKKPWLLFTCDEEIGGIGADYFCRAYQNDELPKELNELKCLIEIDRKGSNDAVYYDCANEDFEDYITSKGFKTAYGSFSDISLIAPELGVAAVNLSSGYYNAHQLCEYINRSEIDAVLYKVVEIVADVAKADFPKYRYAERNCDFWEEVHWCNVYDKKAKKHHGKSSKKLSKKISAKLNTIFDDDFKDELVPKRLPLEYEGYYYDLVDDFGYSIEELEYFREQYGDKIIYDLYVDESGFFYRKEDGITVTAVAEK